MKGYSVTMKNGKIVDKKVYDDEDCMDILNPLAREFCSLFDVETVPQKISNDYCSSTFPPCDEYETEDGTLVIKCALAGYKKDNISLAFKDDYLILNAKGTSVEEKRKYSQKGIKMKDIEDFVCYVPSSVYDISKAEVKFDNGILEISIPKSEKAKPIELKIK